MLKEGDGCDPAVSHVPCGVLGGAVASHAYFFLLVLSSLCQASCTLVLCSPSTSGVCLASATPEPLP